MLGFFNDLLFWNMFRFTGTLQREFREFLCAPHSVSHNVNILHYHGMFVKTKKLTLVHYEEPNVKL